MFLNEEIKLYNMLKLQNNCNFSYNHYKEIIENLKLSHKISTYSDSSEQDVILRHDVDSSLEAALKMAKLENKIDATSTYFILLHSEFFNPFSLESSQTIKEILDLGHKLGLHYDESFIIKNKLEPSETIKKEIDILEQHFSATVEAIAAHDPTPNKKISINLPDGVINAYSKKFFKDRKYLSDSAQNWREGCCCEHIENFSELHILTHPMWWSEEGKHRNEIMKSFTNGAYDNYTRNVQIVTEKHALHYEKTSKK